MIFFLICSFNVTVLIDIFPAIFDSCI